MSQKRSKLLTILLVSALSSTVVFCSEDSFLGKKGKPPGRNKIPPTVPSRDTTSIPSDTTSIPKDTTSIPSDTTSIPKDTTGTINPADIIFEETFEGDAPFSTAHSMDVGGWDYALQFVTNPAFKGKKCSRFEIRDDQNLVADGIRSEVVIVKGADGEIGKDTWYSFAVFFPSDGYEYDDKREVINQWYQNGSPATSIRTEQNEIYLESGNDPDNRKQYPIAAIEKDKWHTFTIHIVHSYESDGLIELWYDGVNKITLNGGNMYDDVLPKWKVGLYKSAFKDLSSDVHRRVIYYDNIRVGNQNSTYSEMIPSN